jgi:hypothetical protein
MKGRRRIVAAVVTLGALGSVSGAACTSSNDVYGPTGPVDGAVNASCPSGDVISGAGGTLKSFAAPCSDPGGGAFWITMSGEANALTGYPFPPSGDYASATWMVDGWQFTISAFIVVVDHITLWSSPDVSATDQSQHGGQVAQLNGPFVVDLHKGGPIVGQGGGSEEATPIGVLASQNSVSGSPAFDTSQTYAFGFSTVPAPADYDAYNVNLTSDEAPYYALMAANGYSVFYRGTATWNGTQTPFNDGVCTETTTSSDSDAGADGGSTEYDFTKLPQTIDFELGFSTPTNYVNCQNGNPQGGMAIGGEDNPRGLQSRQNQSVFAQVTIHMDHPFWDSFAEDSPVHWDQIAAQYLGQTGIPTVHVEDMQGVPFDGFTDHAGVPLPWRNCSGSYFTEPGNGQMFFDTLSVEQDPGGTCVAGNCPGIRDYYDFIRYTQSTQGHLNSQGLCFIDRQYPAP